nr:Hsp20 family protein [uncultured Desulfobacter sp.]
MEKSKHINRKIAADLCSYVDEKNSTLHLEFMVPGVKKENIDLKVNDDSFSLRAEKNDVEYVSTGSFCYPVEVSDTKANYENGILLIDIPLKDRWKGAVNVTIH